MPAASVAQAPPCAGGARVGTVVALAGEASALARGEPPRSLACDATLRACEEIVTAPGASLAFLTGDVLVRVGADARVRLAGSAAAPALFVERGAVRATDTRGGGAKLELRSAELSAVAAGADAELLARPADGPSRLCIHTGAAAVVVGEGSRHLGAGECLAAKGGGVATFVAGEPALGLEAAGFCALEVARDGAGVPTPRPPEPLLPGGGGSSR